MSLNTVVKMKLVILYIIMHTKIVVKTYFYKKSKMTIK